MKRLRHITIILILVFFFSGITFAVCGDGILDLGEQCDGVNLNNLSCEKLDKGYNNGELICNSDCTINTTNCAAIEIPIENPIQNLPPQGGAGNSGGGNQTSSGQNATVTEICGDGLVQNNEECDESDLSGKSCQTFGYLEGNLTCTDKCIYDVSDCAGFSPVSQPSVNDNVQKNSGGAGGLINDSAFPVSNLFSAGSLRNTYIPEILGIVAGIWSIMMSFSALKIRKQKEKKDKKEILSNTGE